MEPHLQIKDLGEASVLLTLGYKLIRLDSSKRGNHKIFIFAESGTQSAKSILESYRSHEMQVDAYTFFMNTKELKARIHDMNDSEI